MSGAISDAALALGRPVFSLAIVALGVETWVCANYASHVLGPRYEVVPVLPWLSAIPWLAYAFGAVWVFCGVGLLSKRTLRICSMALGSALFLCAVILDAPKYAANIGDIPLRTIFFEPLALASLAWLLPGEGAAIPGWLLRGSRYPLALSLIVFGVDHFLVLAFIAGLIPPWIPWHTFWAAFFGVAFIAAGLSVGLDWLRRPGAGFLGLMFAIWVVTLHLPRVLGFYGIPGALRDPDEWYSLLIAVALWGGLWALARVSAGYDTASPQRT